MNDGLRLPQGVSYEYGDKGLRLYYLDRETVATESPAKSSIDYGLLLAITLYTVLPWPRILSGF